VTNGKWLRARGSANDGKVSYAELFFDLVFVFSITQLSHLIAAHYTPLGFLEGMILVLAVWWLWMFTTWATNWIDPGRIAVRFLLFVMMLGGMLLSVAIPKAWDGMALLFAGVFVAMQVGRSLFMALSFYPGRMANAVNFLRIAIWMCASGVFWISGALTDHETRLWLWLAALAIEYSGPAVAFWIPGLGASNTSSWNISGAHMAERCALFVIICLGESIIVSGATFAKADHSPGLTLAFLAAFLTTGLMWWIYFHVGHEKATHLIEKSNDPGRVARSVFTYAHILIVVGIILDAVAAEFMLAHPDGHTGLKEASAILGGPAIFLLGNIWFKGMVWGRAPLSHMAGLVLMAGLALVHASLQPWQLGLCVAATLCVVAVWEARSLSGSAPAHH
jgi:low temperature requirement protein LtrA